MNLRKAARGRPCQLRIPGVCNRSPDTTVLAHIRRGGVAGVGQKPPDIVAVWACSACHDQLDRRPHEVPDGYVLEALCRQLAYYAREGIVRW